MLKNAISAIKKSDGLVRLIAINAIIFVVIQVVHIFSRFSENDRFVEAHPDLVSRGYKQSCTIVRSPMVYFHAHVYA
jgi:hypothetical protein